MRDIFWHKYIAFLPSFQQCETDADTRMVLKLDIPAQEKMTLKAAIMYKSNWQQGSLKGLPRSPVLALVKLRKTHLFTIPSQPNVAISGFVR